MENIINEVKFWYYIKLKGTEDSPFMSDLTFKLVSDQRGHSYILFYIVILNLTY